MNTYDEGKYGEDTSIHTTKKIGSENKNKVFTEEEKADYLNNLRNKYKDQKSIEQQSQYVYYDFLDKNNRVFEDKKEFEKFQNELKEKIKNEKDPKKREELEKQVYRKVSDITAQYHNIEVDENGEVSINLKFPNEKHVNNVGQEAVFDKKTGSWIKDGINNATYNIVGRDGTVKGFFYDNLFYHLFADESDVNLWIKYDIGPNQILTQSQREELNKIGTRYFWDYIFRGYPKVKGKMDINTYKNYIKLYGVKNNE